MQRPKRRLAWKLGGLVALMLVVIAGATSTASARVDAVPGGSTADALSWNLLAVNTVRTAGKAQVEGLIYMSYVQASVYDAVTKIEGRYAPYHDFDSPDPAGASPDAAVAAATYTMLNHYFPSQALTDTYNSYLSGLPVAGRDAGAAVGAAAASDIITFRTGDGLGAPTTFPYGVGPLPPGVWVFAPSPSVQAAQTPWVGRFRPFMLESPSQFRPGPPLSIDSNKYATQLDELHTYGGATGSARTDEQTRVAQFWNANAINQINETLRNLTVAHGFDLVQTTRALVMGDMVDSDAGIACFDAKYHYTFWRPVTAIRNADLDGNDRTTADPTWTSLLVTPNHPEYPAAHGCLTSSDAEVDAKLLDTHRIEVDIRGAVNGGTTLVDPARHYATVEQLDKEIVNARVWAGLHFRDSGEAGVKLGRDVAHWALDRYFLPTTG